MAAYISEIIINTGPKGAFVSASQKKAGVMAKNPETGEAILDARGDAIEENQFSEPMDLDALKAFIAGLKG